MSLEVRDTLTPYLEKLKRMQEDGVSFSDLYSDDFMKAHTEYLSIYDFLGSGGFAFRTNEEFDSIPVDELNSYVSANTGFDSWNAMKDSALQAYLQKL